MKIAMPRRSRSLDKMRAGKKVISYKLNLSCPRAAEIPAICDFDCLWLCQEHVPTDLSVMEAQIMAAKAHNTDVIVRVAKGSYSDYIRPLELDATGLMIPHMMNADEARKLVEMTRFAPIGKRPVDGGNADGQYCLFDFFEYIKFVNENRMLIVQIEDVEAIEDIENIAAVPGIDMLFFGPADMTQSLGDIGNFSHPEIARMRKLVVEVAHRHGKFAGTTSGPATLQEYYDMGYDFINCGADVVSLMSSCQDLMKKINATGYFD